MIQKPGKLTASKVANHLDISTKTLTNWYEWYNNDEVKPENMPELPAYEQEHDRAPRFWSPEDLPKLEAFKEWVPRGRKGIMSSVNCKNWTLAYRERRKQREEAKKEKVVN